MHQVLKTEIITGLIATIRSRIMAVLYTEQKKTVPNEKVIDKSKKQLSQLSDISDAFYSSPDISDSDYKNMLSKILSYAR